MVKIRIGERVRECIACLHKHRDIFMCACNISVAKYLCCVIGAAGC